MLTRRVFRQIQVRPRLFIAGAVGVATVMLLPTTWASRDVTRWILGWNAGAWLYLFLAFWMMSGSRKQDLQRRAREHDEEGALTILGFVVVASLASLGAIVAELSVARGLIGAERTGHIALAAVTILASWAFTQMMFALHYAHDFYSSIRSGGSGGLAFPGTDQPDYWDFLYFAVVIGTSAQTADVSFTSSAMRRVGLVHCVLAFLFNTSLIALTINVASGLL